MRALVLVLALAGLLQPLAAHAQTTKFRAGIFARTVSTCVGAPFAIVRPQGVKAKIFYTAYQTNGYGLGVPADSPIQKAVELKGKNIGVTNELIEAINHLDAAKIATETKADSDAR